MTISRVENCVVCKIILVYRGVMSFAQDILEADNWQSVYSHGQWFSQQIATVSPRGK